MNEEKTLEEKVSSLLSDTPESITIGGKTYTIAPPTLAKLARISSEVSKLNIRTIDPERLAQEAIREATHSRQIAECLAVMLEEPPRPKLFKFFPKVGKKRLAEELFHTLTPSQANLLLSHVLQHLELGDFFALSTFLQGINVTHRTKVENSTTALGQP